MTRILAWTRTWSRGLMPARLGRGTPRLRAHRPLPAARPAQVPESRPPGSVLPQASLRRSQGLEAQLKPLAGPVTDHLIFGRNAERAVASAGQWCALSLCCANSLMSHVAATREICIRLVSASLPGSTYTALARAARLERWRGGSSSDILGVAAGAIGRRLTLQILTLTVAVFIAAPQHRAAWAQRGVRYSAKLHRWVQTAHASTAHKMTDDQQHTRGMRESK